jgi:hypothetical protein
VIAGFAHASPGLIVVVDAKAERRFDDVLPAGTVAVRESISHLSSLPLGPGVRILKRCFTEGRVHGLSQLWGTQDLTDVPVAVVAQSSAIWCFKTAGTGLEILRRRNYLLGVPDGLVENLPDDESPPDERGEFVRLRAGKRWDSKLYRF